MKKRIPAGGIAAALVLVGALAFAGTAMASPYSITTSTGHAVVPGVTDIGNHCDDCVTTIALPFAVNVYGTNYTSADVSSNGDITFGSGSSSAYSNVALPTDTFGGPTLLPHWDDLETLGTGRGIFTDTLGSAPNRQFVVEWRAVYYSTSTNLNFEAIFTEGSPVIRTIYGTIPDSGSSATVGIEQGGASGPADQFSFDSATLSSGLEIDYVPGAGLRPVITAMSSHGGPTAGGQTFTITGENFSDGAGVLFGTTPASTVIVNNYRTLTVTTPAHAPGAVDVYVVDSHGRSEQVPADAYTFTAPPGPTAGPAPRKLACTRVPDLTGHTLKGARWILKRDGCKVPLIRTNHARRHPTRIVSQKPAPGTPLYVGDKVYVTVD